MSDKNLTEEQSVFTTRAIFSKDRKNRYALTMNWDNSKERLAIIMTFPSTADSYLLDQTTMLVRNGAVKNGFGSVTILNLFPTINSQQPKGDKVNYSIIMSECESADKIIVAYGRSMSYADDKERLLEMLKPMGEKLYTIIDSKGLPFSHPLSPSAHEWDIQKIEVE